MNATRKFNSLRLGAISLLAALLFIGCQSPATYWNSRVGKYTIAQARADLGRSSSEKTLDDGGKSIEWITHLASAQASSLATGNNIRVGGIDQPMGEGVPISQRSEYLTLTFDKNGILQTWNRTYHEK